MRKFIKLDKLKHFLTRMPVVLAKNAFLTFLFLLFVSLIFASLVFYQYAFTLRDLEVKVEGYESLFRQQLFEEVLKEWEARGERFEQAEFQDLRNIFEEPPPEPAEGLTGE